MSNCVFGFPLYEQATPLYTPTVTGSAGWLSALPRANAIDRRLSRVTRSTDTNPSNTQLIFDLGVARSVGVLSILIPNLTKTTTPTVQWEGASDAGFSSIVYNSGTLQAWPTGVTAEDVTGPDGLVMNLWSTHIPTTPKTARYWAVIITDSGNTDGYVDVARVIIAGATSLTPTLDDGAQMGIESNTTSEDTDGGATLYSSKRRRRNDKFNISNLANADALGTLHKMMFSLGTSGQVFWVPDPADTTYGWKRNYLGVLKELSPLQGNSTRWNTAFSIREEL